MGQPVAVVEQDSRAHPGVVRFEVNRPLSGMGHERYREEDVIDDVRPVDEVARRIFATGKAAGVHINGSVITVDLAKGASPDGLADIIRGLFLFYQPGDPPPPDPV
jgi:hypothetical protein